MPILEAMAAGIPAIAGNRSSLPEVSGDAALLVNPEDADELGAQMLAVALSQDRANRMIKAGRERAALFTWQKAVLETASVYRELL